jgi:hypothetical protein
MDPNLLIQECCGKLTHKRLLEFLQNTATDQMILNIGNTILNSPDVLNSSHGNQVIRFYCESEIKEIEKAVYRSVKTNFDNWIANPKRSFESLNRLFTNPIFLHSEKQLKGLFNVIRYKIEILCSTKYGMELMIVLLRAFMSVEYGRRLFNSFKTEDSVIYYSSLSALLTPKMFEVVEYPECSAILNDFIRSETHMKAVSERVDNIKSYFASLTDSLHGFEFLKNLSRHLSVDAFDSFCFHWEKAKKYLTDESTYFREFSNFMNVISPRSKSYILMLNKLNTFVSKAASATTDGELESLGESHDLGLDSDDAGDLVKEYLTTNKLTEEEILVCYRQLFDVYKDQVRATEMLKIGDERTSVHSRLKELFVKLIIPMLQDTDITNEYDFLYEPRLSSLDTVDKICRKRPDISVITRKDNRDVCPTFYSMVLPIEAKVTGMMKRGLSQSLAYLFNKLRMQLEIIREDPVTNLFGYAIGSDGYKLNLAKVEVKENNVKLRGCFMDHLRLCPDSGAFPENARLEDYPGLVALLSLLHCGSAALGHVSHPNAFGIPNLVANEILGTGSFGSAMLVIRNNKFAALKVPRYSKVDGIDFIHFRNRFIREYEILERLGKNRNVQAFVPHVAEKFDDYCGLLLEEVGISLVDFVSEYHTTWETRYPFADQLRKVLRDVCREVYVDHGMTHRDIRPPNIVMKYNRRIVPDQSITFRSTHSMLFEVAESLVFKSPTQSSSEIPVLQPASSSGSSHSMVTVKDFSILLIDWGIAGDADEPYHPHYSIQFAHDDIVHAHMERKTNSEITVDYKLHHDLKSVDYVCTAVKYNEIDLQAPWREIPQSKRLVARKKMVDNALAGSPLIRWKSIVEQADAAR